MTEQIPQSPEPQQKPEASHTPAQQHSQQRHPPQQHPAGPRNNQPQWPALSVVIPLFNEEQSLKELHQQLRWALGRMNLRYEILFVDDGSTDRSFQVLRDLKRTDRHIRIIRFRRNYGKSAALSVGFEKAQGNIIVTLDADLQDDPAEIPALKKRIDEGFDLVSGWKKKRRDPISKTIPSRFFNFVTARITGIRIHDFNCGLKAYRREVAKSVKVYGELHRYVPVLAHWEGFKVGEVIVQHRTRKYGKSKFGVGRFWRGFLDLLTALFTTRYLRRPLHLFGFWGLVAVCAGVAIDGWLAIEWFLQRTSLSNRPLFLGGILCIIVGIQFVSIGLLGEMISRTRSTESEYQIRDFIK
jgi:glycosyltransferase involved in cell wall biosynthesis